MNILLIFVFVAISVVIFSCFVFFLSCLYSEISGTAYVPIKKRYLKKILQFGELTSQDNFYDLGSGDGKTLIAAHLLFHVKNATGYEISPLFYLISRVRIFFHQKNDIASENLLSVFRKSFYEARIISPALVYVYLYTEALDMLAKTLFTVLPEETRILSVSSAIADNRYPYITHLKSSCIGPYHVYLYKIAKSGVITPKPVIQIT